MLVMNKEELKFNCKSISNLFINQYFDKINKCDNFLLGLDNIGKSKTYIETSTKTLSEDIYKVLSESKNKYRSVELVVENKGFKTVLNTIDIRQ